jgi:hypothetical protein
MFFRIWISGHQKEHLMLFFRTLFNNAFSIGNIERRMTEWLMNDKQKMIRNVAVVA